MRPFELEVRRGMAWLDANYPGWVGRIDLDNLVLSDCYKCVIGQLAGSYGFVFGRGPGLRGYREAIANGFGLDDSVTRQVGTDREFWQLTDEWKRQIQARRDVAFLESAFVQIAVECEIRPDHCVIS